MTGNSENMNGNGRKERNISEKGRKYQRRGILMRKKGKIERGTKEDE